MPKKEENKRRRNILVLNFKGGAGKTTGSSICASYLEDATLAEVDKINQSDSRINGGKYYKSEQIDFNNEVCDEFLGFENLLLASGVKVIDVGATKLEIFHKAMSMTGLYDVIDLLIIPAMDGNDDFIVAMNYLATIKDEISPEKIMLSFNRFNEHEYSTIEEQFESFFLNKEHLLNQFGLDLDDESTYFILKDSRAVKRARKSGVTIRSLAEEDLEAITKQQRAEEDSEKRLELGKQRSLINTAQLFEKNYIFPMMEKISRKIS